MATSAGLIVKIGGMNAPALDIAPFRCPRCGGNLNLQAEPDHFVCPGCSADYPVVDRIPRFAGEGYVASFGRQWNRYDVARDEEDDLTFTVKTGVPASDLAGKLVLDAGCGGGRYARLLGKAGANVVGLDLSSAVEKASALCAEFPNVTIVQGDLLNIPLADESFDFAFSIGVMHHSPDPRRAFDQVARKVKPGGGLAVWLYRKNTWPQELINSGLRVVSTRLPAWVLEPISVGLGVVGGIPLINKTLNKVVNFSGHPDWTLRVCDNFDWYAPKYQSHHTVEELRSWFTEAGFGDLKTLRPAKSGRVYNCAYEHDLVIGSGVNMVGWKR